jgi:hypothetical protein
MRAARRAVKFAELSDPDVSLEYGENQSNIEQGQR